MQKILKNNIHLILLFVLSVPAIAALIPGGFYGASDDLHIAWLNQMHRALMSGQIPPRFVPDLSFGFGYPLFNFVFPLPFYIGEVFHLVGFSLVESIKIVFGISLVVSAMAMYSFLKSLISKNLALLGALVYLYTPYRSTDVYVRGAVGESLSFVFLPLVLNFMLKIYKNESGRNIYLLALSLAGLILTHNIISYMFTPFLILLVVIFLFSVSDKRRFLFDTVKGIGVAFLISSYFWIPAIKDSGLMVYSTVFNFIDHFPTIRQLITPKFGYGASVAGPYDGMSFFVGTINLLIIFLGCLLAFIFRKRLSKLEISLVLWTIVILLGSVFMMNFRSTFLWQNLPLIGYFQFPWRFLTLFTFASPILLVPFDKIKLSWFKFFLFVLMLFTVGLNARYFRPHDFLGRQDDYYLNRYIPVPTASEDYKKTQEEYLRLPKTSDLRPDKNYPLLFSDKEFVYDVIETNGIYLKAKINTNQETKLYYSKYNFPGWQALIDGQKAEIGSGKPFGQIAISIPEGGSHILEIDYKETNENLLLDVVSLLGVVICGWKIFKNEK